jgi:hypothetical protein
MKVKKITKQVRQWRAMKGRLRDSQVKDATFKRYLAAVSLFWSWLALHNFSRVY